MHKKEKQIIPNKNLKEAKHFNLITKIINYPSLANTIKSASSIEKVRDAYKPVTEFYYSAIEKIRPDVILINGTFFLPWCLLQAAKKYGKAKIILHYHGVLTKEVEHWKEKNAKKLFKIMEQEFDSPTLSYVFPSKYAKDTVEKEVYGHSIKKAVILPNPIPDFFFKKPKSRTSKIIGMVSRWTKVKNPNFLLSLAEHNKKINENYGIYAVSDLKSTVPYYHKVSSAINILPPVENKLLPRFYRKFGILIMPSFFETYGNVAQEAIAAGIPALVSPNTGVAETFKKIGLKNWIIDFSCPKKVLSKIEKVLHTKISDEVIKKLHNNYNNKIIFEKYTCFLASKN